MYIRKNIVWNLNQPKGRKVFVTLDPSDELQNPRLRVWLDLLGGGEETLLMEQRPPC